MSCILPIAGLQTLGVAVMGAGHHETACQQDHRQCALLHQQCLHSPAGGSVQCISQHSHWRVNASTVLSVDQSTFTLENQCQHSLVSGSVNIHTGCSLSAQSCQHSHQMFTDCTVLSTFTLDIHCLQSCQHSHWIFTDCTVLSTFTLAIH